MLGKEHIVFSILFSLPIVFVLPINYQLKLLGLIIIAFSSLIPDIDEENSIIYRLTHKTEKGIYSLLKPIAIVFQFLAYMLKFFVLMPIYFLFSNLKGHRLITHTLIFAILVSLLVYFFLKIVFPNYSLLLALFVFLGILTHLIGDSLTLSGTTPLLPIKIKVYDSYITGKNSWIPIVYSLIFDILFFVIYFKYSIGLALAFYLVLWYSYLRVKLKVKRI